MSDELPAPDFERALNRLREAMVAADPDNTRAECCFPFCGCGPECWCDEDCDCGPCLDLEPA